MLVDLHDQPRRGKLLRCTQCGEKQPQLFVTAMRPQPVCRRCLAQLGATSHAALDTAGSHR
jgi:uncharacterized protein (DUF983 family)